MEKIVFLDRDGVVNKYPGDFKYVISLDEFEFIPGSIQAIVKLNKAGYQIYVISNQAGITKGVYLRDALDSITNNMVMKIEKEGGKIEKVLYCIHTDEQNCDCRKPKIGLINQVTKKKRTIDLKNSFVIGDTIRDIKTGKNAGCKTILVLSGKEKLENKDKWEVKPDFIADNLLKAAEIILNKSDSIR